ncbi:MAG: IS110 family transposase, partial [Actinomycetota bacterium]|nr:IS110 family transposase [Actinomycetota bacterium]
MSPIARRLSTFNDDEEVGVRSIGMDVHRDFCEIAIAEDGAVRTAGRVATTPEALELFAQSLAATDAVAIEATANALAIARIVEPHVGRVVLANPQAVRETSRRAKTDKIDAKVLAQLLAAGFLDRVWTPDEAARTRRRLISRRAGLVRQRTREKNQIHAALGRNLVERQPMSDLFGVKGRGWLAERVERLPLDERLTVGAGLRQIDFIDAELAELDKVLAADALSDPDAMRLMTLPGIRAVTAIALLGAIGDIRRFRTPRHLVGYLGLDPRVRQSGSELPRHGRISKQGPGEVRGLLVEAAWHAARTAGPLRAFHQRLTARRGGNVATVAVARKLVIIAWHLLSRGEDYAFMRPSLHREKIRRLELMLGAPRQQGK